jgi:hypothetical protein
MFNVHLLVDTFNLLLASIASFKFVYFSEEMSISGSTARITEKDCDRCVEHTKIIHRLQLDVRQLRRKVSSQILSSV